MMEIDDSKFRHRKRHLSNSCDSIDINPKQLKTDDSSADLNLSFQSDKSVNEVFNNSSFSFVDKLNDFQLNVSIDSTKLSIDLSPIIDKPLKSREHLKIIDEVNCKKYHSEYNNGTFNINGITESLYKTPVEQTLSIQKFIEMEKNFEKNLPEKETSCLPMQLLKSQIEILIDEDGSDKSSLKTSNSPETPSNILDFSSSCCVPMTNEAIRPSLNRIKSLPSDHSMSPIFYQHKNNHTATHNSLILTASPITGYRSSLTRANSSCPTNYDPNPINYLTSDDVARIVGNEFTCKRLSYHIIDCRYPYEFDGGHILGAVNLFTPWQLLHYIFLPDSTAINLKSLINPEQDFNKLIDVIKKIDKPDSTWKDCAFIFHCEFSSIRGPKMAECLRTIDRILNLKFYPELFFPNIYILSKGYKDFFNKYQHFCTPDYYVKMEEIDSTIYHTEEEVAAAYEKAIVAAEEGRPIVKGVDPQVLKMRFVCYSQCKLETQNQMMVFSNIILDKMKEVDS